MNYYIRYILAALILAGQLHSEEMVWDDPVNISIVNTESNEYAPVWNKYSGNIFYNSEQSGYSKFYIVEMDENDNFSPPVLLEGDLNAPRNNQSYITFLSRDVAYLSTFRQYPDRPYMNIFQTRRRKNEWLKPYDVDSLVAKTFMGHPSISPDGTMLVFASDLNSQYGDTDIWLAFRQENNTWGSIMRISQVQTPGNEITPFFASNDTIYFSSNGQEGPGGYDLFMTVRDKGVWQMPFPIVSLNTEFDESDFTLLPDGKAIFASNRAGGKGGLDLYISSNKEKKKADLIINDIEISIAAQVPNIKVNSETKSVFIPPFTNIFYKFDKLDTYKYSLENFNYDNDPKQINDFSLQLIAERLKQLSGPRVFITAYTKKTQEEDKEKIRNFIIRLAGDASGRLNINIANMQGTAAKVLNDNIFYITMMADNDRVFASSIINHSDISVIPPALDLSVDARPRGLVKKWACSLVIGDIIRELIHTGSDLPGEFYHNLAEYKSALQQSDSLEIEVTAEDSLGRKQSGQLLFFVGHSNTDEEDFVFYNGKKYIYIWLSLVDWKDLKEGYAYINTFRSIVEFAQMKKNVIIQYKNENSKNIAEQMKSFLLEQPGSNLINVNHDKVLFDDKNSSLPYSAFLFRILVEVD